MLEYLTSLAPACPGCPKMGERDFLLTLMAMAGHDLRQPLQIITSAHDVLATMLGSEKQRQELAQAANATGQLARMLGQLVEALQLRERSRDDLAAPVRLKPLFDRLETEFHVPAKLKGITLRIDHSQDAVLSHPILLTSILRNLVHNAIAYTPSGGFVFVTSLRRGSELHVSIRDTGAGIRADALARIFEAFHRADGGGDGLGLGLFIVKHAADLLGHRISVRSAEGRGS
jgi:two-component system phosphate regulon sensor histidine kinase PhoR